MPDELFPADVRRRILFFQAQIANTPEVNRTQFLKTEKKRFVFRPETLPAKTKRFLFAHFLPQSDLLRRRRFLRQPKTEFTAFAHSGGGLHTAAMLGQNAFYDVQAQTAAAVGLAGLAHIESVKNPGKLFRRDAAAGIRHADADAWHAYGTDTERYIMSRLEEPYASYLADKTAFTLQFAIYYKLTADGEEYGPVIREFTCNYPIEYTALDLTEHTIYGLYGSAVTERMGWRRNIKYSITATRGCAPEDILFPQTIPVEVQVHKGPNVAFIGTYPYGVRWQTQAATADENTAVYPLDTLFLPAQASDFVIRNQLHRFSAAEDGISAAYPGVEEVLQSGPSANLYVNFVEEGYLPTVALAWNRNALEAIFDYKPTGAQALEVYTSADSENWTLTNRIACGDGLPGDIYKNAGYSTVILSQEQADALLSASHEDPAKQGFFVRLRIIGGPLGNRELSPDGMFTYTDTAPLKWPEHYEFEPGGSGDTTGSGGNQGNTGTDNDASKPPSAATIVAGVTAQAQRVNRGVVLMHDSDYKYTTVAALPEMIELLKEQGFSFSAITPSTQPVLFDYRS